MVESTPLIANVIIAVPTVGTTLQTAVAPSVGSTARLCAGDHGHTQGTGLRVPSAPRGSWHLLKPTPRVKPTTRVALVASKQVVVA